MRVDVGGRQRCPAAVLESCKDEKDLRLTLLKPAKEEDEPDTKHVALPAWVDADARVLAVSGTKTAVYLPIPRPQVVVYDDAGNKVSEIAAEWPLAPPGATPALTGPRILHLRTGTAR